MPRLSDIIEDFIKELFKESEEDQLEIQRNELATYFKCAPSQINYVLTTRFTTERGYYIESKRGGGGCIKICRVHYEEYKPLMKVIKDKIGESITYDSACQIIQGLYEANMITEREKEIMRYSINDRTLSSNAQNKNQLRADILNAIMMVILH